MPSEASWDHTLMVSQSRFRTQCASPPTLWQALQRRQRLSAISLLYTNMNVILLRTDVV